MAPVLMLCIDFAEGVLRTYELRNYHDENGHLQYAIDKKGTIKVPYTEFLDFVYDIKEKMLLGLVQNVDMIDKQDE